jgi:hypothetical protein
MEMANTQQHSIGPWTLHPARNHLWLAAANGELHECGFDCAHQCCGQLCYYIASAKGPSSFVADIIVSSDDREMNCGSGIGNAALIVAAPELLEACKAMVGVCEGFPDIAEEPSVAACMAMATKAIERAEQWKRPTA